MIVEASSSREETAQELLEVIDQQSLIIEHLLGEVQRLREERGKWNHEQLESLVAFRDAVLGVRSSQSG